MDNNVSTWTIILPKILKEGHTGVDEINVKAKMSAVKKLNVNRKKYSVIIILEDW